MNDLGDALANLLILGVVLIVVFVPLGAWKAFELIAGLF